MKNSYISMRKVKLDMNMRKDEAREYESRIHSPSAVVFDIEVGGYPLFVMLTPELLACIVSIHKKSSLLSWLQSQLPDIAVTWYRKRLLIDEIKLTNDIENVHSTRKEVKEAVESVQGLTGSPQTVRFYGMADKYLSLFRGNFAEIRTCQDVRSLYDTFVQQEVVAEDEKDRLDGEIFRKNTVYVQDSHGNRIHDGVYPESRIIELMERALFLLNNPSYDRLIRIAAFHYLFGYIHPFYNGNGRLSRYISSMLLCNELGPLAGLRLSCVIKNHKKQYDRLFKDANDAHSSGDITDFVFAFCEYVEESLSDMMDTLQDGIDAVRRMETGISGRQEFLGHEKVIRLLALNGIFAEDALSIEELQTHAECGRKHAQDAIEAARKLGILTQSRYGHKYLYSILPDVWPALIAQEVENQV